jgi:predicted AlkP superfamily pyrophosphatase or phosphodiesterase
MQVFKNLGLKSFFFLIIVTFSNTFHAQTKPKMVVGIVVDQMCYEYLFRYQSKFSKNGFVKLMKNGTHCRNTQYNYVPTYTGPGHASIYTGTTPSNHGIVGNDWFVRSLNKDTYCVADSTVSPVGSNYAGGKSSPHNLKANTITDQLKLTYPNSKVISMSIKDRSAVLPGGHLSDGSYWYDYTTGGFLTSSYFKKELPSWIVDFNAKKMVDAYMQQTWNTHFDISQYTESGPDDTPYEQLIGGKKTPTFPYDLKQMKGEKPGYDLFTVTPFANTFLTDFAIQSLTSEKLGETSNTDFLCISYSTPDIAGHAFGPYSIEIEDVYIRLDLEIARLVKSLEEKLGKNNFVLFLTADHAVVPVPQYLTDRNLPGGYLFAEPLLDSLKKKVETKFGVNFITAHDNNNIYFDRKLMQNKQIDLTVAQEYVKNEVRAWTGVKRVFTAQELENSAVDNEWKDMVKRGFRYEESGDVLYLMEPGYLPTGSADEKAHKGTSHGSAFNYDTHVPLIWYGTNIPKQEVFRKVNITDITATLVHILNLQKPNATTGEPILEIFKGK